MDKEDIVCVHTHTHTHTHTDNGISFRHKNEILHVIFNDMYGSREYNAKRNRERHKPYEFTHMWSLGNKINEKREKKRQTKSQTVTSREQIDSYQRRGGWVGGWRNRRWGLRAHLS